MNFLKKAFIATFVVALSLGFASCSDSDDDNEGPVTPKVILLPTLIVEEYTSSNSTGKTTNEHTLSYNDKGQLTLFEVIENANSSFPHPYSVAIAYQTDGRVAGYTYDGDDTSICTYDDTKGTVSVKNENELFPSISYINKNGYLTSNQSVSPKDYYSYEYDSFLNLIRLMEYDEEEKENGKSANGSYLTVKYDDTHYSPYVNIKTTAWLLQLEIELPMWQVVGSHLPKSAQSIYSSAELDKNGKLIEEYKEETLTAVTVEKSKDGYPEWIKSTSIEKENGEEENTTTYTYTITYKEITL